MSLLQQSTFTGMNFRASPNPAGGLNDSTTWRGRWHRFSNASIIGFHRYATWLVGITGQGGKS